MIYLDSDVIVHSLFEQEPDKHIFCFNLFEKLVSENKLAISTLTVQEVAFVLSKLNCPEDYIRLAYIKLLKLDPIQISNLNLLKAIEYAESIKFKNINDCIHLAIAENECSELITYNKKEFLKLSKISNIKVSILN